MENKAVLAEKFDLFDETWTPKIIAELNGQYVKLAKFKGEMVWHSHENEDEYFQVVKGQITLHLRDRDVVLNEGECFVVPRGVEHKPSAQEEAHVLMFEPKQTGHTGNDETEITVSVEDQEWI